MTSTTNTTSNTPAEPLFGVIDEADFTDGPDGTIVEKDLTQPQAEALLTRLCNGGGDAYIVDQ
jgi:hypothetical protein